MTQVVENIGGGSEFLGEEGSGIYRKKGGFMRVNRSSMSVKSKIQCEKKQTAGFWMT